MFGTVLFFYGGWPFLSGGVAEIRARQPGMMLLIGLAITVAFVASLATSLRCRQPRSRLLVGARAPRRDHAARSLARDEGDRPGPGCARRARRAAARRRRPRRCPTARSRRCRSSALRRGDVVLVRPGARVPADGAIVDGEAEVDESMVTGESRPVPKQRRRPGGRGHGRRPTPPSVYASPPSATTPRSPASSGSSPRRRRRGRARRRSPTAPPHSSSTSPPAAGGHHVRRVDARSAPPTTRSSAP